MLRLTVIPKVKIFKTGSYLKGKFHKASISEFVAIHCCMHAFQLNILRMSSILVPKSLLVTCNSWK